MTIKIDQQITGYSVVTDESEQGQGQKQPHLVAVAR